jgi:hypothetical protein
LWLTLTLQVSDFSPIRDPYKHIISYLTGGLLGAPWLFFTVVAFVYGYFFTGSLLLIFRHFNWSRVNYVIAAFAVMLLLVKNVEGVNTVRTWTGLWILVYACLRYYDTKNSRYIFLMLMPPFVHFGYFIMVIPALVVLVLGTRPMLYAVLFVASSATNLIPQQTFMDAMTITERSESQAQAYFRENEIDRGEIIRPSQMQNQRFWRTFQEAGIQKWALNVLIYAVLAAGIYFVCMSYLQRQLFSIGLLTLALSNSTWFIYALSNRSWIVGAVFILAAFILANTHPTSRAKILSARKPRYYKIGLHLSLLLFVPYFLYNLSVLLDYPSIFLFGAPFMVWLDPDMNVSLKYVLQILLGLR